MKRYIYILAIAIVASTSCVERLDIPTTDVSDELVVTSLISPDNPIEANIAVSHPLNSTPQISFPEQAELELMGTGLQGSNLRFSYKESTNSYVLRNQEFRPVVGGDYEIRAFVPGSDVDTIFSTTSIPNLVNVDRASFNNVEINPDNNAHDYFMDLTIKLKEEELGESWLHVIPTYKTNTSDEQFKFQIIEVLDNRNAVSAFYLEEGVFIDITKFEGSEFKVRVSTLIPVKAGTLIKELHFETRATTKDYFSHHKTRARQKESSEAAFSSPITDFSNIQNGLGIFAGYSVSTHSIKF